MNGWYKALENLVWLTQFGLSLLMPLLLCLAGCWWLTTNAGVGGWVYLPGFLLGLGGGAAAFRQFARMLQKKADADKPNHPAGFNRH
ncbi:MAG: AtpZ/AtpI family protein [Gemmiger sp.]|nr:AtpZ/AtpI family protein [Gemmiger sp.]